MVVEYLEGRPRGSFDSNFNEKKTVLASLLLVSQHWHIAALASICDSCVITFTFANRAIEVKYPAWPDGFSYPQFYKPSFVKRVVVKVRLWNDACEDAFRAVIDTPQYENMLFPSATSLVVMLSGRNSAVTTRTPVLSDSDAVSFARSIRRLAPAVASVVIEINSTSINNQLYSCYELYETLVSELCQGVSSVCIRSKPYIHQLSLDLHALSGLTSLVVESQANCVLEGALAYRNASTLKELKICVCSIRGWISLVYGRPGPSVVYTSLTSLTLVFKHNGDNPAPTPPNDLEPFPALSTLDISVDYPFVDDILFRGNGKTLKHLRLPFCALAKNALGGYAILERQGVTRMNSIYIDLFTHVDKAYLATLTDSPIVQQVHHMLEVTLALHLTNDTTDLQLYKAIKTAPSTAILQNLHFGDLLFDSINIIEIISALPSLVSLSCRVKGSVSAIEAIPASELPSRLYANFFSPSIQFRKLRAICSAKMSAERIAIVVMQIAVVCPCFVHIDLPLGLRKAFSREVAWATYNEPFKPYAKSLRRLI
ncbi:hypothetical protein GGI09_001765 [Coemansia sp. S100]|nr:hypothetical protein LPJ71_000116 [Coemansia sp. S17]KAJ2101407.1 hypothetical protein GGI09_001765 [Coemansia sp. S100]KAJ2109087.1 hypothetical protein GGI16_000875 [Coemansia sp. S142-1]